jgi:hypothetical protein
MEEKTKQKLPNYYIVGIGLCLAFGTAFDNIGLGVCFGLVFGTAIQKLKKV